MVVNGIDVSKWQGEIDWSKAKYAGAQFAIIRAGSINQSQARVMRISSFKGTLKSRHSL